jgi:uncharacterized protein YcbX
MTPTIASIYRHPVKGLSPEPLDEALLTAGAGLPNDRRFALARASTTFNSAQPEWQRKQAFLMLMLNNQLAALETQFGDEDDRLTIKNGGRKVASGVITTTAGRTNIEDFIGAFLGSEAGGKPQLIEAPQAFMFSDHRTPVLSIINLASVRDLEQVVGKPINPLRFRANIYIEGLPAWAEFDLLERTLAVGECHVEVTQRIPRCPATNVEPGTGTRDMSLSKTLKQAFGHVDMGIYGAVIGSGAIRTGDECIRID